MTFSGLDFILIGLAPIGAGAVNAESAEELQSSKSGWGFFLVKRFVQQLQRSNESGYHMVEVLIHRE
jgi:hypothetical protein